MYVPSSRGPALPGLSLASAPTGLLVPGSPPAEAGIVHLGLGNFHRAHQAVMTAEALAHEPGPWGIVGVAQRSREVVDALRAQDLLYSVLTLSPGEVRPRIPAVLTDVLVAHDQPEELLDRLGVATTRIVTLTVTEKGYAYSPRHRGLDLDDPRVAADLAGGPPRSVVGQLVRGMQRRLRTHGAPLTVLCCDNLSSNGDHVHSLVNDFVQALGPDERDDLAGWIAGNVTFPNTMVDRIVPATTDRHRSLAAETIGVTDRVPVPAEPFGMWVMEDTFAAGRPGWPAVGAICTDQVAAYELLKLRLLNGTHSLIAYLGLLAGHPTIAESIHDPAIEQAARAVMLDDYLPTLHVPADVDIDEYTSSLFERFGNSAIGHRAAQVGSDGSLKLPVRVTEPILMHAGRGRVPRHIALSIAAFVHCLADPDSYDSTALGRPTDPSSERLAQLGGAHTDAAELSRAVLCSAGIFAPELADHPELIATVAEMLTALRTGGVAAGVRAAAG